MFRAATLHSRSPSHRVVEQQLLIPGFLPEFLETSGDQENLRFLEKVATGNRTRDCWVEVGYLPTIPQQLHDNCSQISVKVVKLSSFEVSKNSGKTFARSTTLSNGERIGSERPLVTLVCLVLICGFHIFVSSRRHFFAKKKMAENLNVMPVDCTKYGNASICNFLRHFLPFFVDIYHSWTKLRPSR